MQRLAERGDVCIILHENREPRLLRQPFTEGEIGTPANKPWCYELEPIWQSPEAPTFVPQIRIPPTICAPAHTYRARVRHKDVTGRWSHWSEPVEFVAK